MNECEEGSVKRRRGAELEKALLDAAWSELLDKGYERFTIESVAERAKTSRAVLYRRWSGKAELVKAAATRAGEQEPLVVPDTGSLREDVIELMRQTNRSRSRIGIQLVLQMGAYFAETGTGMTDLRNAFLSGRSNSMALILDRAVARGEADRAKLSPRIVSLPFDLYRQELLMTLKSVPDEVAAAIVDEVFLPLVRKT